MCSVTNYSFAFKLHYLNAQAKLIINPVINSIFCIDTMINTIVSPKASLQLFLELDRKI